MNHWEIGNGVHLVSQTTAASEVCNLGLVAEGHLFHQALQSHAATGPPSTYISASLGIFTMLSYRV